MQWNKRFGGSGDEQVRRTIQTSDGGYIIVGESNSPVSGNKTAASKGGNDFWVLKINSTGTTIEWDKTFGGSANEEPYKIIQTIDNQYLVSGLSASGISGDKTEASKGSSDFWAVKFNSTGTKIWDKSFGGTLGEDGYALALATDGSFVIGGISASANSGDRTQDTRGGNDFWIVKFTDKETINSTLCGTTDIYLNATGCSSLTTWSTGATTNNIVVPTSTTTTYTATCTEMGCPSPNASLLVSIVGNLLPLSGNATNGPQQAVQTITSIQIVQNGINSTYRAGNSISLNNGFLAQNGSIFKAEIGGCSN